jgi:DNA replication protein DnaC
MAAEVDGIPAKYRSAEFRNCDPNNPAVAAVMAWAKELKGIALIYGLCGRGKTYLAAAAKKELNRCGAKSRFCCEDEILVAIKSTFNPAAKMTEGEVYDLFTAPEPLIIDDIGAARTSDFTFDVWDVVIGRRYREECPTLITSNYLPVERGKERALVDRIGDRAFDRIRESKMMFELGGENRRAG